MAHRGGRVIDTDTLRLFLVLRVSRDGQEREQGSEHNPNVHAHQGKPCDAWEGFGTPLGHFHLRAPARQPSRIGG